MQKPSEPRPAHPTPIVNISTLAFHDIRFKHQSAQFSALDGISFEVKKGEAIVFVGPSGAGKSTLVKLLVGLYHTQEGKVTYNGVDGHAIDMEELRNQIGFVTQDTQLFAGTIKENLLFVAPEADDAAVIAALEKASCAPLLAKAQNGIDSMIGEGGLKLSGGERGSGLGKGV